MKKEIELKDVKKLNEEMFDVFTQHNDAVMDVISKINKVISHADESLIDNRFMFYHLPFFKIIREDGLDASTYEDDGNTKTEGVIWSAYWAFPLNGKPSDDFSVHNICSGDCPEAVVFTLESFQERLSDKRISGCKFFSLYFSYGDYSTIINTTDREDGKRLIRLDYQNNNYVPMSILKKANYAKIILCVDKLNKAVGVHKHIGDILE